MFKGKKIIIFDMDCTLIDSVGMWNEVDRRFIKSLGGNADGVDVQLVRDTKLREFKSHDDPYKAYCEHIGKKYNSSLSPEELVKLRYDIALDLTVNDVDFKPNADIFIRKLKELGFTLIIASTTKRGNMDVYRTRNQNILKKAVLDDIFTAIYTREDAKEIKPCPEIYERILREHNVAANECLVFEDSLIGVEAANNAKIDVVAIYDKYSDNDRDEINKRTIAQFNNYKELLRLIK